MSIVVIVLGIALVVLLVGVTLYDGASYPTDPENYFDDLNNDEDDQ